MKYFFLILLVTSQSIFAQEKKTSGQGIRFENALTWEQVKAKAKTENKYIFIDVWTTWCAPCIYMNNKVFPLSNVGAFFNKNFINVKLQLDTSTGDNEYTRTWYADAHNLGQQWNIQYFPTFIFLNADAELVHRAVGGSDGASFIALGKEALNPKTQFYTLKRKYEAGEKDSSLLYALANAALRAADEELAMAVTTDYFATQKNLLTRNNLLLLRSSIRDVSDEGFKLFIEQGKKVDAILGSGEAMSVVKNVITYQLLYPVLYSDNQPEPNPDWNEAQKIIKEKFTTMHPDYLKILMASIKADHQKVLKSGSQH